MSDFRKLPDSGKRRHATVAEFSALIKKHAGIHSLIAAELGITRRGVADRIARTPRLQDEARQLTERLLDLGEGHILKAIQDGDLKICRWYLERKGRDRGYGAR